MEKIILTLSLFISIRKYLTNIKINIISLDEIFAQFDYNNIVKDNILI
jgi:hypothetical protein